MKLDFSPVLGALLGAFAVTSAELPHTPPSASVVEVPPGTNISNPACLTVVGNHLVFATSNSLTVTGLWSRTGNAPPERLGEVLPLLPPYNCEFTVVSDVLFFAGRSDNGPGLWRTDGTVAGTAEIRNGIAVQKLTPFRNGIVFAGDDFVSGNEPWFSDGTEAGTRLLKDIAPGSTFSISPNPQIFSFAATFLNVGDFIYFGARSDSVSSGLWRTDGTPEGTVRVADLAPWVSGALPQDLFEFGGKVYFSINQQSPGLWRSDGTQEGTVHLSTVMTCGLGGSGTLLNERFFFGGVLPDGSTGLWSSDGTSAETRLVAPTGTSYSGCPSELTLSGDFLYYSLPSAAAAVGRDALARTDGTTAGSITLGSLDGPTSRIYPTDVAGSLLFASSDPAHGNEIWKTDGTSESTALWDDVLPGMASSSPQEFKLLGNRLYFVASNSDRQRVLWVLPFSGGLPLPPRARRTRTLPPR